MTPPPPSDPIRPIGPVTGGIYVGRAEQPWRTSRRPRRDEEGDAEQRRNRHGHGADADAQQDLAGSDEEPAAEAGVYDDHGRTYPREAGKPGDRPHRHVDASA